MNVWYTKSALFQNPTQSALLKATNSVNRQLQLAKVGKFFLRHCVVIIVCVSHWGIGHAIFVVKLWNDSNSSCHLLFCLNVCETQCGPKTFCPRTSRWPQKSNWNLRLWEFQSLRNRVTTVSRNWRIFCVMSDDGENGRTHNPRTLSLSQWVQLHVQTCQCPIHTFMIIVLMSFGLIISVHISWRVNDSLIL